jgi:hypothetical protein
MDSRKRIALLLVVVSGFAGCFGPCFQTESPGPAPAPQPAEVPVPQKTAPAEPVETPPERNLDDLLRDLESEDEAVVLAAAKQLVWEELSHAEMSRIVPLLWKALLADPDFDSDVDFDDLRSMIGSSEIPAILATLPQDFPDGASAWIAGGLHRMMRAEHIPLVAEAVGRMRDPAERWDFLYDCLVIPLGYTNRHRELATRTLLRNAPRPGEPVWQEPESEGPGLPLLLGAGLDRFRENPEETPLPPNWLARWLYVERPGPKDEARLIDVLEKAGEGLLGLNAARALGFLSDAKSMEALAATGNEPAFLAARVRRGDAAARRKLLGRAAISGSFLAVLFEVDPEAATALVRETVLGSDEDAAFFMFSALDGLVTGDAANEGVVVREEWFAGIGDEALRQPLTGLRLASIGRFVPGARTREIAERAATLLSQRPPRTGDEAEFLGYALPFLEVGAPGACVSLLRKMAASKVEAVRESGLRSLVALGDRGCPDLLDPYLARLAADFEIDALAQYDGLPPGTRLLPTDEKPIVELLLAGEPVEAVLACFRQEGGGVSGAGWVKDERIRDWLLSLRRDRSAGRYAEATGQLAIYGDPEARAETWAALTTGRYRWVDNSDSDVMTLGHDWSTIPFWISELESNCCRFCVVAQVFEDLFGIDPMDFTHSRRFTPAEVVAEFWAGHSGDLVFSRLAGRYVPGVR